MPKNEPEPEADFYEPLEFEWTEDLFIARQAAREFSENTSAEYD